METVSSQKDGKVDQNGIKKSKTGFLEFPKSCLPPVSPILFEKTYSDMRLQIPIEKRLAVDFKRSLTHQPRRLLFTSTDQEDMYKNILMRQLSRALS